MHNTLLHDQLKYTVKENIHKIPLRELCRYFDTSMEHGLTNQQAKELLQCEGPNVFEHIKKPTFINLFCRNLNFSYTLLLWISGIALILAYIFHYIMVDYCSHHVLHLGFIIIVLLLGVTFFSAYQEKKILVIEQIYNSMMHREATVLRSDGIIQIPVENIVIGDVLILKAGDWLPADVRIFQSRNLIIDNSSFTGTYHPIQRSPDFSMSNPLEASNLIFHTSKVVDGSARGIVIATGENTVMSCVIRALDNKDEGQSILSIEIDNFIHILTFIAIILAIFFFIFALYRGSEFMEALLIFIAVYAANIPEMLIPTLWVSHVNAAKRMAKVNCLVKNSETVGSVGSTSAICVDKTSVITLNRKTVSGIWCNKKMYRNLNAYTTDDKIEELKNQVEFQALLRAAMLNNRAEFLIDEDEHIPIEKKKALGCPIDIALLQFTEIVTSRVTATRRKYRKLGEIVFNTQDKYELSIHSYDGDYEKHIIIIKGAPDTLKMYISTVFVNGGDVRFDINEEEQYILAFMELASNGDQVICFTECLLNADDFPPGYIFDLENHNFDITQMRFLGFIAFYDPIRSNVPNALNQCRKAGIKVILLTGDDPISAKAIAKQSGIMTKYETVEDIARRLKIPIPVVNERSALAIVMHGEKLKTLSINELDNLVRFHKEIVFARITPDQKLRIVESLQRIGYRVIVTGRRARAAEALKAADTGVSLGVNGSDASKEAADIILMDDNFASIVNCIEEGRLISDNLKKTITYTVRPCLAEFLPFIMYFSFDIPLTFNALGVILLSYVIDFLPALALVFEKKENDLMQYSRRHLFGTSMITFQMINLSYFQIGMLEGLAGILTYFFVMTEHGFNVGRLFNLRSEWDKPANNDLVDSYGQEWTYVERKELEFSAHSAVFVTIIIIQWFNLVACKTRRESIIKHGFKNMFLNFALLIEGGIVLLFVLIRSVNKLFFSTNPRIIWWLPSLTFGLFIIIYEELRKMIILRSPGGWMRVNTYY